MEISVNIENNIRWQIVRGPIDIQELTRHLKQLYNSQNFDPDMNTLWDLREADFASVRTKDINPFQEFVEEYWGKGGKSKAAIVVSDDLGYGLSRMYEIFMGFNSPNRINIFKDIDEAKKSLSHSKNG